MDSNWSPATCELVWRVLARSLISFEAGTWKNAAKRLKLLQLWGEKVLHVLRADGRMGRHIRQDEKWANESRIPQWVLDRAGGRGG